jgi:kinetochor protein Mis14/NSL1
MSCLKRYCFFFSPSTAIYIYPTPETNNCGLVLKFIHQTYTLASDSISINGVDLNTSDRSTGRKKNLPLGSAFSAPETIEYEAFDGALASRVSSLYAQLESLTTSVAQLRREAPGKAAKMYADTLNGILAEEDAEFESLITKEDHTTEEAEWKLDILFGSEAERERWQNGEMAEVYSETLQTLLRLQGEYVEGDEQGSLEASQNALSTTIGKAERAGRAVDVVKKM